MTLDELFNLIRPQCEMAFWHAWAELGYTAEDHKRKPAEVSTKQWEEDKEKAWAKTEAKQAALYAEHGVWDHPEMAEAQHP